MQVAKLHPACVWDCENCGTENWVRCFRPTFTEEDKQELAEHFEEEDIDPNDVVMLPETVVCKECGAEYDPEED